ncbi:hypothetical protein DH2020_021547 [Rehmannia glutinosa]|uniref:CCHC-type domain-containing protein n=1 Tax=Rehmannia glutinosa TaxID=99300 RepID=A0ABR0WBE6_REHGL
MDTSPISIVDSMPHFTLIILRLDRTNYHFWKAHVLSTVRAHGFEGFLFGTELLPPKFVASAVGSSSTSLPNSDYTVWMRRDQFLLRWMLYSIGESMLGHVSRCSTSHEVWIIFEKLFQSQSKARSMQIQFMLQIAKKGDLTIDEFLLKMKSYADDLNSIGQTITDEELVLYVLDGLESDYKSVVVNLTTRSDLVTLQEAQFVLQTHEMRLRNSLASTTALTTSVSSNVAPSAHFVGGFNQSNFRGGRFPRGRGRGGHCNFRYNNNGKPTCQLCGKIGHMALKCYKRFDMSFTGPINSHSSGSTPQSMISAAENVL